MRNGERRWCAVAIAIALLCAVRLESQEAKLTEAIVPPRPPIALDLPPADADATAAAIERALTAAGVPFGLEAAGHVARQPPANFARRADNALVLNGLSVGKALDAVVAADPRYTWGEQDGRIMVRVAASRGVLQMPLGRLELEGVAPLDALETIALRLNPSAIPSVLRAGVALTLGGDGGSEAPPLVASLSLANPTLLEALNALARVYRISWKIRYDDDSMDAPGTSVTFLGGAWSMTAASSTVARAARDPAARHRVLIPVTGRIQSMIGIYASRMHLQYGLELVPEPADQRPPPANARLDLTGATPAEAISRIVDLDSRYEWFDSAGIFLVRPRRAVLERTLLDREVSDFSAADELLEDILLRIVTLIGAAPEGRGGGYGGSDAAEAQRKLEQGRRRRLSFSVARGNVRDVLSALCRAEGTLSWTMHPQPTPDGASVFVMFQVDSSDGWSVGRNFRVKRW